MHFSPPHEPVCLLVDNGSLRPAATLNLRRIAHVLTAQLGRSIAPVSLLHADKVSPAELDGVPAEVFVPALRDRHRAGIRKFLLLPLFFGPSRALTEYVPQQIAALAHELPGLEVCLAQPLVEVADAGDRRIAHIVAEYVRNTGLHQPAVVLVDHGSPEPAVTAVRDHLARQLREDLGESARTVVAASMERRPGAEYAFNEPLLARALAELAQRRDGAGEVVVAPLFFSPGRHAGTHGDIHGICRNAETIHPRLRVHMTPLVGEHPQLIDILADRFHAAMAGGSTTAPSD